MSSYKNNLRIYFHNASGIRTKVASLFYKTSHLHYDIIIIVESWLYPDIYSKEIFDERLYDVVRSDRCKVAADRGGGIIIAVRTDLDGKEIKLPVLDVEQLGFSVVINNISKKRMFFVVSYVTPNSKIDCYQKHMENIEFVNNNCAELENVCVLGDFNLTNIKWTWFDSLLIANNIKQTHEYFFIDFIHSLNLSQINSIQNSLSKILDLVFVCCDELKATVIEVPFSLLVESINHKELFMEALSYP